MLTARWLLLLTLPAFAAEPLARRGQQLFELSAAPSLVLAAVTPAGTRILGYGAAAQDPAHVLLRIGSLSKPLAGRVLELLAAQGRLRLDAPGPAGTTLLQLATHTSGLPRQLDLQPPAGAAPFTWPDAPTRLAWAARQHPTPGPALYSNVAYDLLGDTLAAATGTPYPALLQQLVTGPLGLRRTTAAPDPALCARLLPGAPDEPTGPCRPTTNTAASGGLYSTPQDMAIWLKELLLHPPKPYLRTASLPSVQGLDFAGPPSALGLGWVFLDPRPGQPALIQKTGGGGGFFSYLVFAPSLKVGLFLSFTGGDVQAMRRLIPHAHALLLELAAPPSGTIKK